jgi:diguanylate cyclase (GGDEF)-like protein
VSGEIQKVKILVVDDDPVNLMLTCQALEKEGYTAAEADSGESALQTFAAQAFDLVLLDVIMTGMNGFEVCRHLRSSAGGRRVPIMIMTGLDDDESIKRAYDAGATDFITKPITWSLLGHRVRYILRASEAVHSLAQSRAGLANAQRVAKMGSWDYNLLRNEMNWSDEIFRILEMTPGVDAPSYESFLMAVHPKERDMVDQSYQAALRDGTPCAIEHRLRMPGFPIKWVSFRGLLYRDGQETEPSYMVTVQDITERKLAEERVNYLAYYDELTGLPNRNLFQEHLTKELEAAQRYRRRLAVLMFNLNRFRRINDTFGLAVGDRLLKQISELIRSNIRRSDYAARFSSDGIEVVRWTGDEFAITVTELANPESAGSIAQRVLASLNQPCRFEEHEITVTACAGIAIYPEDGSSVEELVKNSQSALWSARKSGPNNYRFYAQSMNAYARQRLIMESNLRQALEQKQLELFYQPLIKTGSFEIIGAEALLRWRHPEKGIITPGEFISLAEEIGLIIPIGEWVLATACSQAKAWHEAGHNMTIAVNLSADHFQGKMLLSHVKTVLSETGIEGLWLDLEVTESVLMRDFDATLKIMEEIRDLGVRFAIDDFGTGYSSLSYLKRLPVHALKIDQSFVADLPEDPDNLAIVRAVVALSRSLGLTVVAEGVETSEQAQLLTELGIDILQGYLFSRPVPADQFGKLLAQGRMNVRGFRPVLEAVVG